MMNVSKIKTYTLAGLLTILPTTCQKAPTELADNAIKLANKNTKITEQLKFKSLADKFEYDKEIAKTDSIMQSIEDFWNNTYTKAETKRDSLYQRSDELQDSIINKAEEVWERANGVANTIDKKRAEVLRKIADKRIAQAYDRADIASKQMKIKADMELKAAVQYIDKNANIEFKNAKRINDSIKAQAVKNHCY